MTEQTMPPHAQLNQMGTAGLRLNRVVPIDSAVTIVEAFRER